MEYRVIRTDDELYHYGVKGMKWGVRRYQNKDGTLTPAGKMRYLEQDNVEQYMNKQILKRNPRAAVLDYSKALDDPENIEARNRRKKTIAIGIGIGVGITVAAASVYYVKHKKMINETVATSSSNLLKNIKPLTSDRAKMYENLGLRNIKTENDANRANWFSNWVMADKNRYSAISKEAYNNLDDNDIYVKAGQQFSRITSQVETNIRNKTFVSYDPDDVNRYTAFLPTLWKTNRQSVNELYTTKIDSFTDVRSPSAKKRVDIFINMLKEDEKFLDLCTSSNGSNTGYRRKNEDIESFALRYYKTLASNIGGSDWGDSSRANRIANQYLDKVKSLGYNALVDDNDAGRVAKTPLILLKNTDFKISSSVKLTGDDIRAAANSIVPMDGEDDSVVKNAIHSSVQSRDIINTMLSNLKDVCGNK